MLELAASGPRFALDGLFVQSVEPVLHPATGASRNLFEKETPWKE
jgi:hypothetical protein